MKEEKKPPPSERTNLDDGASLESSEINHLVRGHGERSLNNDRATAFGSRDLVIRRGGASGTFLEQFDNR